MKQDARVLDTIFLSEEEAQALDHVIDSTPHHELREALAAVSGITNPTVLDLLVKQGITPRTLASIVLVPLVEIAWADGELHEKEHQAIMVGLDDIHFAANVDRELISRWIRRPPNPLLLNAWKILISDLCEAMGTGEIAILKQEIYRLGRLVASAEGGFLGFGAISAPERAMLDELQAAFTY